MVPGAPVESPALFESPALPRVTGTTLRPGGFTLTRRAVEYCQLAPGAAVLDIGCGLGATPHWLADRYGLRATGLDPSRTLLGRGRRRHGAVPLVAGCAERLPVGPGRMEAVFCECVLSLLPDPAAALAQCRRVLKSGGWLIVTDVYVRRPAGRAALRELPGTSCLTGACTRTELLGRTRRAGFQIEAWEDHSALLTHLAAEWIFTYGSLPAFWSSAAAPAPAGTVTRTLARARPGYYLMLARPKDHRR